MTIKEINGMRNARVGGKPGERQELIVVDGDGIVWIRHDAYAAPGLTPDEAEWFAKQIIASARRVRAKAAAKETP